MLTYKYSILNLTNLKFIKKTSIMMKLSTIFVKQLRHKQLHIFEIKRFAGHSKWQNIRHIKGAKDAERSLMFVKLGRQMKVAVQAGGSVDPKLNLKLSQVVDQAKRCNMPVATIQNILKTCQIDKSKAKSQVLEIKGPGGCFILCEIFSDQLVQLKGNIASILRKHKSQYGDGGGLHFFEEKGVIIAERNKSQTSGLIEDLQEMATWHAIECGAEDVEALDEVTAKFLCDPNTMSDVTLALEKAGYVILSANQEWVATRLHQISEADAAIVEKLYTKLEALPEVVSLADNIA